MRVYNRNRFASIRRSIMSAMDANRHETKVLDMLGDPKQVDRELRAFRRDAQLLSAKREQLLKTYPEQWVAIYEGKVAATAPTLPRLVHQMKELRIPRGRAAVRFMSE